MVQVQVNDRTRKMALQDDREILGIVVKALVHLRRKVPNIILIHLRDLNTKIKGEIVNIVGWEVLEFKEIVLKVSSNLKCSKKFFNQNSSKNNLNL